MAEVLRETDSLQIELEKAKESLKDVDESIKKLTGRDPLESRGNPRRVSLGTPGESRGRGSFNSPVERRTRALSGPGERGRPSLGGAGDIRGRLFALARQGIGESEGPPAKRRIVGGAFSRLGPARHDSQSRDSGDEDDLPNKPTVQSSVVPAPGMVRTRKESIEQQNKDEKGKARNRRMFGLLLGTLQKFRSEAKEHKDKDEQRRQIEVKLEDKAKQEKEDAQKERQQLFKERRDKMAKVQILEQKMELVNMYEEWEVETKKLKNFLRTKAKPHVFYKPRSVDSSDSRVRHTHKVVDEMIKEKRKKLDEDLEELSRMFNKSDGDKTRTEDERESRDGGREGKERSGKRAENKENVKRKGDRKRRKSHDHEEEEAEEEDGVSVGMEETGNRENRGKDAGFGGGGEENGGGDQGDDNDMDTGMDHEDQNELTQDSPEKLDRDEDIRDVHVSKDSKGSKTSPDMVDENTAESSDRDIGRRVVLAEDEDENGMENAADGDPEQADE